MAEHSAEIRWTRENQVFIDRRYSRVHTWAFDGGVVLSASPSPANVPVPHSDPALIDPEEAFVATVSSCHMLSFLILAAKRQFRVDSYVDRAVGWMERDARGRLAITKVTLRPHIVFSGETVPSQSELDELHEQAHDDCYIANSVRTEITCHGSLEHAA